MATPNRIDLGPDCALGELDGDIEGGRDLVVVGDSVDSGSIMDGWSHLHEPTGQMIANRAISGQVWRRENRAPLENS
jgi:hypothetical protein